MASMADIAYRQLLENGRLVEDLLKGFMPEPWVEELDYSTLCAGNTAFITSSGRA